MSDVNGELMDIIAGFHDDPVGYINYVFPWGEEGTPLEQYDGLRDWQLEFFTDLGEQIKERGFDGINPAEPIQFSTSSGHGIGKSACTAMLIKFIHDTRPFSKGVVTANTSDQLKTKTWAELGKWHNMSITKDWSAYNSGKGNMNLRNIENPETWRVDAQTSKDENSESFAGLHAANSTPFYIFDEASAVAESIYEVANGGLTDGEPMWFLFGNPTRNSGYFHSTHNKFKHRWTTRTIDSRDVEGTNNGLFAKWIEDFGEDSDFVRVRVRGLFPRSGSTQFISTDFIEGAINRDGYPDKTDPLIIGVDVARQGDDQSVIYFRRGRDARTTEPLKLRLSDTMDLVGVVSQVLSGAHPVTNRAVPQACFIDGCGVGGGVVDRLRQLGFDVIDVNAATKADNNQYANKRAEMWGVMRDFLRDGGIIPDDIELRTELESVEYGFNQRNQILLEKKETMKRRGLSSPDIADALALTFAFPVAPKSLSDYGHRGGSVGKVISDFDPFEDND